MSALVWIVIVILAVLLVLSVSALGYVLWKLSHFMDGF